MMPFSLPHSSTASVTSAMLPHFDLHELFCAVVDLVPDRVPVFVVQRHAAPRSEGRRQVGHGFRGQGADVVVLEAGVPWATLLHLLDDQVDALVAIRIPEA